MNKAKQIIVIRTDLKNHQGQKVRTGKLIAQACHASIAFLTNRIKKNIANPEALWWVVIPLMLVVYAVYQLIQWITNGKGVVPISDDNRRKNDPHR